MKEIESSDWDLLISQIASISHFQHKYGSKHLKTLNQLKQITRLIENIISFVNNDNKTILFLISDSSDRQSVANGYPFILSFSSQKLSSIEVR